ncbi:MAG: hypothetical protein D6781_10950 [Verrucomicrobia bacterium]|nr:MAG: hypothetical protein D6781_10950 [Verrucomicrobiota bacterium]
MPTPSPSAPPTVHGLVITLQDAEAATEAFRERLRARAEFYFGEQHGKWLPVSVITDAPRALHGWLEQQPEIAAVDVVFVEIDAPDSTSETSAPSIS